MKRAISCAFLFLILFLSSLSQALETINSFDSRITILPNSDLLVTQEITVNVEYSQIRHGIYYDFQVEQLDKFGNSKKASFQPIKILRDGKPEPYHQIRIENILRTYIGDKNVDLPYAKRCTYTISFLASRQLDFLKDYDQLYYNVTGAWGFPIEKVIARITLPSGSKFIGSEGFTGASGSRDKNFQHYLTAPNQLYFATTDWLKKNEGLTIRVAWPKGVIKAPDLSAKLSYFFDDNIAHLLGLVAILISALYFFIAWLFVGKDPSKESIIPIYEPPSRLSPATMRYIMKMGYDNKVFTAALISMAVKGYIKIEENNKGEYLLKKIRDFDNEPEEEENKKNSKKLPLLSAEEKAFGEELFSTDDTITLSEDYITRMMNEDAIKDARTVISNWVKKKFKNNFIENHNWFIAGAAISCLSLFVIEMYLGSGNYLAAFSLYLYKISALLYSFAAILYFQEYFVRWKAFLAARKKRFWSMFLLFTTTFLMFVAGTVIFILSLYILRQTWSYLLITESLILVGINATFYLLLKKPTIQGRKLMDKIEGFKVYLSVAEKDRMNFFNPPQMTPELFEKYLPYALALDVENQWAKLFENVIHKANLDASPSPHWYSGGNWTHAASLESFTSSLNSTLLGVFSSSSSSSGGGSSGGGGGSSGGGGW